MAYRRADDEVSPETIEFIWGETRGAVDAQLQLVERLDSKAFQSIGVGSALIGLVALGADTLLTAPSLGRWFLIAAVSFYALSALFTLCTVNIRHYRLGNRAGQLWPTQWQERPLAIKHALVADWAEAYRYNDAELHKKTRTLRVALVMMALETATIGAAIASAMWEAAGQPVPSSM